MELRCHIYSILFLLFVTTISAEVTLVDLSYTFNKDAPMNPNLQPFEHKVKKKGMNQYNIWTELNDFCTSEHSGTHLDAPVHNAKGKWSVEQIPNTRLFRVPGVKINLESKIDAPNYEIQPKDLEDWEWSYGTIPDGAVVLLETGWGKRSNDINRYSGLDVYNKMNFPGLSRAAAKWLADHGKNNNHKMGIIGVGVDTFSLDVGQSVDYPAHVALFQNNIYGLENVANMNQLPAEGFLLTISPVKIGGGSGAPARIIAETSKYGVYVSSAKHYHLNMFLVAICILLLYGW